MNGKLSHPKMYICASARDLALYIEQQRIYCYIPVGVLPDRFMVENLIFPPPDPAVLNRLFLFGGHRVISYIEGKSTEIILCWSFSRVLRKIQYTLAISPGFLTEFETKINKKNLFILVFFKGIVSQDFRGLLVILIDRAYGPGIPLDVFFIIYVFL